MAAKLTYIVILIMLIKHYFKFYFASQWVGRPTLTWRLRAELTLKFLIDSKGHSGFAPRAACLREIEPFLRVLLILKDIPASFLEKIFLDKIHSILAYPADSK
jgi:hypothetical protein